jgi:plasmid stability protein
MEAELREILKEALGAGKRPAEPNLAASASSSRIKTQSARPRSGWEAAAKLWPSVETRSPRTWISRTAH